MPVTFTHWTAPVPPDSTELLARLHSTGNRYVAWANAPGDTYAVHSHEYDKHLVCLRGSIRFTLPAEGGAIDLTAGDELHLPAHTPHGAIVGANGVECAEAHLRTQ